jgi:hypothetical protein
VCNYHFLLIIIQLQNLISKYVCESFSFLERLYNLIVFFFTKKQEVIEISIFADVGGYKQPSVSRLVIGPTCMLDKARYLSQECCLPAQVT